ncbi:MAG: hypothetical protein WHT46_00900 [Candidatus Geothermincolales bacterium]
MIRDEVHCPLCHGLMREEEGVDYLACIRCGTLARFCEGQLEAVFIPGYHRRMEELGRRHQELLELIEAEGRKGALRDMRLIRSLHEERQRILSEYSFYSYFQQFVDRW